MKALVRTGRLSAWSKRGFERKLQSRGVFSHRDLVPFCANNHDFAAGVSRIHRRMFYESPQSAAGKGSVVYRLCSVKMNRNFYHDPSYDLDWENGGVDRRYSVGGEREEGISTQARLDEQSHTGLMFSGNLSDPTVSRQDQNAVLRI